MGFSLSRHFMVPVVLGLLFAAILSAVTLATAIVNHDTPLGLASVIAIVIAALGIVSLVTGPSTMRDRATEDTLTLVSKTLDCMVGGLTTTNCQATCELLLPYSNAVGVAMSDTTTVLGFAGSASVKIRPGMPVTAATARHFVDVRQTHEEGLRFTEAIVEDGRNVMPAAIVVPLVVRDRAVGAIKFFYRRRNQVNHTQVTIARGLGEVLSTQLSVHELDRQAELTARAELKALQAQINPHFLFNTINTIAAFTRTDPDRARFLLREFASFYRQTLENSDAAISIARELDQTRRYLTFEHARFGEERIVEREVVEEGCEKVPIPPFVIQPVVENAVRHAMRDEGALHIDIHVVTDGLDVLVAVADDGVGMSESVVRSLLAGEPVENAGTSQGTGRALRNVAERVQRYYGSGSGVDIVSRPEEGTCVTIRLAGAAHESG